MATSTQLLDLEGIGQRQAGFRFDLLDASLVKQGEFGRDGLPGVPSDVVPVISHSTTNAIMRQCRGWTLDPASGAAFDPIGKRVQVVMVLENGATFPLGTFLFSDEGRDRTSLGVGFDGGLVDLTAKVDRQTEMAFGVSAGTMIRPVIVAILEARGITVHEVTETGWAVGDDIAWPPFVSWLAIVNELAALAGCLPLWFTAGGVATVVPSPDILSAEPDVSYRDGVPGQAVGNILATTIRETSDRLTAPNRFIVVDSGATASNIRGVYDLPASAPNSYDQIGEVIPHGVTIQGLPSVDAANEHARLLAITEGTPLERIGFDGLPDPRHVPYAVTDFRGTRYLEESWTLPCVDGANMAHVLVRIAA